MALIETTKRSKPTRITGLWRVLFDDPRQAFWCGSVRFAKGGEDIAIGLKTALGQEYVKDGLRIQLHPTPVPPTDNWLDPTTPTTVVVDSLPDGLFWIFEKANQVPELTLDMTGIVTKADTDFYYMPYRFRDINNNLKNFHGMIVNGYDNVLVVGKGTRDGTGEVKPIFTYMIPNNAANADIGADPTRSAAVDAIASSTADFAIRGVRHLALYNGSVVYAGYKSWNPQDAAPTVQNFHHWAVFSNTIGSDYSAYHVDVTSAIQIGDSPAEPITGCVVNSTETDSMGIKGQLLFFTPQKIVYFDGLPPLPDDDLNSNFWSVGSPSPIGSWATRAIVRTPIGVIFLGVDGMVYLVPNRGSAVRIGRAMEPYFEQLNPYQQRRVCAVYHKGHYLLSTPTPGSSNTVNKEQWWADLRGFDMTQKDRGIKWTGPHYPAPVSVFARGQGLGDTLQVMGGSATTSQIFEQWREDVATDAPAHAYNTDDFSKFKVKQKKIKCRAVSNPLDMGDAHEDKLLSMVNLGIGTDNTVDISITMAAIAVDTTDGTLETTAFTTTESVAPVWPKVDTGNDTLTLAADGNFEIVTKYPESRLRGRAFVLEFREEVGSDATADPKVFFQDISFAITRVTKRR
jgi:hypothetical protein